jgi:hypothetical protein
MSFPELLAVGGIGAIAVMQGFILSKLSKIDIVSEKANKLDQWAFGPNGDNGADSEIKRLKALFDRRSGDDRRMA